MSRGVLYIISGPSGSGKTTLIKRLLDELDGVRFAVSCTTRKPRPGECEGVDYFFVNDERFTEIRDRGELAEWASVHGNMYGTPKSEIDSALARDECLVLDIDVQGAESMKKSYESAVYIFIRPPSEEVQMARLRQRDSGDTAELERRLESYRTEMEKIGIYDYIIENDDIDRASTELVNLVKSKMGR